MSGRFSNIYDESGGRFVTVFSKKASIEAHSKQMYPSVEEAFPLRGQQSLLSSKKIDVVQKEIDAVMPIGMPIRGS